MLTVQMRRAVPWVCFVVSVAGVRAGSADGFWPHLATGGGAVLLAVWAYLYVGRR